MSKYGHRPYNWFEAIVNKLGGEDGADRFLRGELVVSKPTRTWYEKDDVIYLSLPLIADGTTGEAWIPRLECAGKSVGRYAKSVLLSSDFVPSHAGTEYRVAIIKGSLFADNARTTANIRAKANELGLVKSPFPPMSNAT